MDNFEIKKTEDEWKEFLSAEEFRVLRCHGTEPAFTGKYHDFHGEGVFLCAGCGNELFLGDNKYDSGTGWPSFDRAVNEDSVETATDSSFFMERTEVHCKKCGGHLGHLFPDGPKTNGLRYCINSASLRLK